LTFNTGVTRFCNIPRFIHCLFAQSWRVRVPVYWNDPNWKALEIRQLHLRFSSACVTLNSSSQFSSPVSDQHAYLHACSQNTRSRTTPCIFLTCPNRRWAPPSCERSGTGSVYLRPRHMHTIVRQTSRNDTIFESCLPFSSHLVSRLSLTSPHRLVEESIVGGE
jgi:hypothetical protein